MLAVSLPGVELVEPVFRQYENGPAHLDSHEFLGGDVVWFDCRVQGYARSEETDPRFGIKWRTDVIDAERRPVTRTQQGEVRGELTENDRAYRPRIRFSFQLPPLLLPGEYGIAVVVEDEIARTVYLARFPLRVGGRPVELSAKLTAAQLRYFARRDDARPLREVRYSPGAAVHLRFDILGFTHGAGHQIDVEYGLLVLGPSGQPFLRQDPAARHTASAFYPQFYVPAALEIQLPPQATRGEYIAVLTLRDKVSGQTAAVRSSFTVE